jgi:hypothetical protein
MRQGKKMKRHIRRAFLLAGLTSLSNMALAGDGIVLEAGDGTGSWDTRTLQVNKFDIEFKTPKVVLSEKDKWYHHDFKIEVTNRNKSSRMYGVKLEVRETDALNANVDVEMVESCYPNGVCTPIERDGRGSWTWWSIGADKTATAILRVKVRDESGMTQISAVASKSYTVPDKHTFSITPQLKITTLLNRVGTRENVYSCPEPEDGCYPEYENIQTK